MEHRGNTRGHSGVAAYKTANDFIRAQLSD